MEVNTCGGNRNGNEEIILETADAGAISKSTAETAKMNGLEVWDQTEESGTGGVRDVEDPEA